MPPGISIASPIITPTQMPQECQKIVEWRHAENGIIGIEQVADAGSRDNRRDTAGNQ